MAFNYDLFELGKDLAPVVMGALAYAATKAVDKWKNRKRRCNVSDDISRNTTILSKLIEIRLLTECDRVKMYQFFNGDYYASGQSIIKCAVTHISVKPGAASQSNHDYLVPASWVHDIVKPLLTSRHYHQVVEDMPDESDWKSTKLLNEDRVIHVIRLGPVNNIRGFLEIAWSELDSVNLTPEVTKEILLLAEQLNGVLIQD